MPLPSKSHPRSSAVLSLSLAMLALGHSGCLWDSSESDFFIDPKGMGDVCENMAELRIKLDNQDCVCTWEAGKISCKINGNPETDCTKNSQKEKLLNKVFEYKRCPAEAPTCVKYANKASICMEACPEGQTRCNGTCIDPKSNPKHCGAKGACRAENASDDDYAGQECPKVQSCLNGTCQCPAGQVLCDEECIDPQIYPKHCGAKGACSSENKDDENYKGQECPKVQSCRGGNCQCLGMLVLCDEAGSKTCIDPDSSPRFCGAKGACSSDNENDPNYQGQNCQRTQFLPYCLNRECSKDCKDPMTNCAGACVDLTSNIGHCGGCKINCYHANVQEATCQNSKCFIKSCNPNFGNCDNDNETGCEVELSKGTVVQQKSDDFAQGDIKDCGTCGSHCKQSNMHASNLECKGNPAPANDAHPYTCSYNDKDENGRSTNHSNCKEGDSGNMDGGKYYKHYFNLNKNTFDGCEALVSFDMFENEITRKSFYSCFGKACQGNNNNDEPEHHMLCFKYNVNNTTQQTCIDTTKIENTAQCLPSPPNNTVLIRVRKISEQGKPPAYSFRYCGTEKNCEACVPKQ